MSKNPTINAILAALYILGITSLMNVISTQLGSKPDTFFAPVIFLSLLTTSVVMMAYLFFYQPIKLFVLGKKQEALQLFAKTTLAFGIITTIGLTLLLAGII